MYWYICDYRKEGEREIDVYICVYIKKHLRGLLYLLLILKYVSFFFCIDVVSIEGLHGWKHILFGFNIWFVGLSPLIMRQQRCCCCQWLACCNTISIRENQKLEITWISESRATSKAWWVVRNPERRDSIEWWFDKAYKIEGCYAIWCCERE